MSFWWLRVWRFAVARPNDPTTAGRKEIRTELGHWRRLWGVLWWGKFAPVPGRPPAPLEAGRPEDADDTMVLCWMEPHHGRPLCGRAQAQWTIEWDYVNCPECRKVGAPIRLSYEVNTR
jgi:hypothetical protein